MSGHEDRWGSRGVRAVPRAALPRAALPRAPLDVETVATLILYRDVVLDRPACAQCGHRTQVVARTFSIAGPISREMRTYECTACGHTQASAYTPNGNAKSSN